MQTFELFILKNRETRCTRFH